MANFASDNVTGASPEILEALAQANRGGAMPYGEDPLTARLQARLEEVFERPLRAFPVATGTAANALSLASLVPPYGVVYCHREAHVNLEECNAPEFYSGGAKLVTLEGAGAKIAPETLAAAVHGAGVAHHPQPAALSITQASEMGTLYRPEEVAALAELAESRGLKLHMDGARFANAAAALGVSPAEITWKAGVDVLSFGGTKNGCLAAEAVIFFQPEAAASFGYLRKRGGHLLSKMRFLSAQLLAYLEEDLWLRNAAQANAMAERLAEGLGALPGITFLAPVEANELFLELPPAVLAGLKEAGHVFYEEVAGPSTVRLVTAWCTRAEEVDGFLADARAAALSARNSPQER